MHKTPGDINKNQTDPSGNSLTTANNNLQHLAFENSVQANLISTVSSGKIVLANKAACKLLGYSKKELLTKSRENIFDVTETRFKKAFENSMVEGKSSALLSVIKKNSQRIPCEVTDAIFTDENGIEKSITTISDISQNILKQKNIDIKKEKIVAANIILARLKQKKIDTKKEKIVAENILQERARSDVRLKENNEWIKYIAKTSYDVMWDWDIVTGEIYVGDSVEEVFGHVVQNNTVHFTDFKNCLLPGEKDNVEKKLFDALDSASKSWSDSYTFRRHDGSAAATTCRASIVRDEAGKAIRLIGAIHDISRLQELENKVEAQSTEPQEASEKFLLAARLANSVIWDWKILSNEIFIGEGFEELFGYPIQSNKGNTSDWGNRLHLDDKETVKKGLQEAINSSAVRWQQAYRFIKADGSVANVFDRATIFRNAEGKVYRVIGVMQDMSRKIENRKPETEFAGDKKSILIEKIKDVIEELIHHSSEQLQTNFSEYLSNKLAYNYTYLANIFSEVEGISIRQFIISKKIERVKELIVEDELTLTEIALQLYYSSVAHLSNQFKKATGFTPSYFKQQNQHTVSNV